VKLCIFVFQVQVQYQILKKLNSLLVYLICKVEVHKMAFIIRKALPRKSSLMRTKSMNSNNENYQVFQTNPPLKHIQITIQDVEDAMSATRGFSHNDKQDYFYANGIDLLRAHEYCETIKHLEDCFKLKYNKDEYEKQLSMWLFIVRVSLLLCL